MRYRVSVRLKLLFQKSRELDQSQSRTSYAATDPRRVNFSHNASHRLDILHTGTKATGLNAIDRLHAGTNKPGYKSLEKLQSKIN